VGSASDQAAGRRAGRAAVELARHAAGEEGFAAGYRKLKQDKKK